MDQLRTLSTGAQIVLAGTIAFLIVSFFNWFDVEGLEEATGLEAGVSMWNGIGVVAGLIAVALLVWQAIRLANINLEIGVSPSMVSAALAVLLLIFAFIRFIDAPTFFDRTIWAWLGFVLAIVVVVGAWLSMQAAGESLDDMRKTISGLGGRSAQAPPEAPPVQESPPAAESGTPGSSEEAGQPPTH